MAEGEGRVIERKFEQPPDAASFFSDFAQVAGTSNVIFLQLYESIPGPPTQEPGEGSIIRVVTTRLRATAIFGADHALKIAELLKKHAENILGAKQAELPLVSTEGGHDASY